MNLPAVSEVVPALEAGPRTIEIRPQAGPQESFLATSADIAVFGGAAGAGKTFGLLLEPTRHVSNPNFSTVIFRRTFPQISNPGGMWDTSYELYPYLGGEDRETTREWRFPSGAVIRFAHMQHEKDRYEWDGAQIPLIGFDQLEHFTWKQFTYMLSRNRSLCGVRPYLRATCNPDPDHFLRRFMSWWIDEESGFPIPERSGKIRFYVVREDEVFWANTAAELRERFPGSKPKSFTFISGTIHDNPILLEQNPEYLANLEAMSKVDRERLLGGNWNIRETAGMFFRREWFEVVDAAPALVDAVRYWDRAATEKTPQNDPSATAGLRMGKDELGVFFITDLTEFYGTPLKVQTTVRNVATQDGQRTRVGLEEDPGQAGKAEVQALARFLAGFDVVINRVRESKGTRAKPYSAQAEAGNVKIVRGPWNETYFRQHENFDGTDESRCDAVDSGSGAFHILTRAKKAGVW